MLIEFSVENFYCFKERATLSMVASTDKKHPEHVFEYRPEAAKRAKPISLLKSAVMYGPNASGKSYFIKALSVMRDMVLKSAKESMSGEELPVVPFLLNEESEDKPTFFELIFVQNKIRYRYGFWADKGKIFKEWLYYAPRGREAELFDRDEDTIVQRALFKASSDIGKMTRANTLFLSAAAQFNVELAQEVYDWFLSLVILAEDWIETVGIEYLPKIDKDSGLKDKILSFLKSADFGIVDLQFETANIEQEFPSEIVDAIKRRLEKEGRTAKNILSRNLNSIHSKFDKSMSSNGTESIYFGDESMGTRKFLLLAGPIIECLERGRVIIIDEFNNSLHALLAKLIVEQFNSSEQNRNNAQFIFSTHDQYFFSKWYFRRDQIWLFDKNIYSESRLYSLFDYAIRADDDYSAKYLCGMVGAIPIMREFNLFDPSNGGVERSPTEE